MAQSYLADLKATGSMKKTLKVLRAGAGQSLVEYALILALVAVAAILALIGLGHGTSDTIGSVADSLGTLDTEPEPEFVVYVASIDLEVHLHHDHVRAHVTVRDQDGAAVSGATVDVSWFLNGTFAVVESDGTDAGGKAALAYDGILGLSSGDVVRLVVTDVSASGHEYDPSSNVENADEIAMP